MGNKDRQNDSNALEIYLERFENFHKCFPKTMDEMKYDFLNKVKVIRAHYLINKQDEKKLSEFVDEIIGLMRKNLKRKAFRLNILYQIDLNSRNEKNKDFSLFLLRHLLYFEENLMYYDRVLEDTELAIGKALALEKHDRIKLLLLDEIIAKRTFQDLHLDVIDMIGENMENQGCLMRINKFIDEIRYNITPNSFDDIDNSNNLNCLIVQIKKNKFIKYTSDSLYLLNRIIKNEYDRFEGFFLKKCSYENCNLEYIVGEDDKFRTFCGQKKCREALGVNIK